MLCLVRRHALPQFESNSSAKPRLHNPSTNRRDVVREHPANSQYCDRTNEPECTAHRRNPFRRPRR